MDEIKSLKIELGIDSGDFEGEVKKLDLDKSNFIVIGPIMTTLQMATGWLLLRTTGCVFVCSYSYVGLQVHVYNVCVCIGLQVHVHVHVQCMCM